MSNSEETFISYFKVRWARRSAWSLQQAAHLTCGKNPDAKEFEISPAATNPVSKRYYWLLNKFKRSRLEVMEEIKGVEYFEPTSILRLLYDRNMPVDKELQEASDHMYSEANGIKSKAVDRSVYREAAKLIFKQYPKASKSDVAKLLVDLPNYFNTDDRGYIAAYPVSTIQEWF